MTIKIKEYRKDLDALKGISIIAVVLYHVGILPYGYLGVDTFLVINGFFIIPSLIESQTIGNYSFGQWFVTRMSRFLPIIIIASVVCLAIGYFVMIPDDYENLSQSTFASLIFCQNILSAITTGNYWDSVNEYKPLMHLWYLGVIAQFYFIFAIILILVKRFSIESYVKKNLTISIILLEAMSLLLYLCPFSFNAKFYYLPFRIWEFCFGGLFGLCLVTKNIKVSNWLSLLCLALLLVCFCLSPRNFSEIDTTTIVGATQQTSSTNSIPKELMVIVTVSLSSVLLLKKEISYGIGWLSVLGKMSLSIFVWHQILLAFIRYFLVDRITANIFVSFTVILLIISYISYRSIESFKINTEKKWGIVILLWSAILCYSFAIYKRAGVVRDVPELGITMKNPLINRNREYTDRIYAYDKPFSSFDKIKVLVVGNSFARDFASVLLEWDVEHKLELSYMYSFNEAVDDRLPQCDYLFVLGSKEQIPSNVWNLLKKDCQCYGISTKSYGKNFGRIYAKRNKPDYYESSVPIHPLCTKTNDEWRKSWEGNFIDFMEASKLPDGNIRLFTDENKVISFDCRHLTIYGCKYYAKRFDFEHIFAPSQTKRPISK